jgi:hypothetical protein
MHAEELPQTQCPQLVGDDEAKMSEGVCRDYPHPSPVSVDDLSTHDRRILESVSPYGWVGEGIASLFVVAEEDDTTTTSACSSMGEWS